MNDQRNYLIFSITDLDQINFDEVVETSANTVRRSVDGTKTFVKWQGDRPPSTMNLTTSDGPYNHQEILEILSGNEWTAAMEI